MAVLPLDIVQIEPAGHSWGGMLGGTYSALGNLALGYQPGDYYSATWIKMVPEDFSEEIIFGFDEGGNPITAIRDLPTVLRLRWIEQALDNGAILLLTSKFPRVKSYTIAVDDIVIVVDSVQIASLVAHETALDSISAVDQAIQLGSNVNQAFDSTGSISDSAIRGTYSPTRIINEPVVVIADSVIGGSSSSDSISVADSISPINIGRNRIASDSVTIAADSASLPNYGGVYGLSAQGKMSSGVQVSGTIQSTDPVPTLDPRYISPQHAQVWEFIVATAGTITVTGTGFTNPPGLDIVAADGTVHDSNLANVVFPLTETYAAGTYYAVVRGNVGSAYTLTCTNGTGVMG